MKNNNVINVITYTLKGVENTTRLNRASKLTYTGAARILRRSISKDVCVVRIETLIDAR